MFAPNKQSFHLRRLMVSQSPWVEWRRECASCTHARRISTSIHLSINAAQRGGLCAFASGRCSCSCGLVPVSPWRGANAKMGNWGAERLTSLGADWCSPAAAAHLGVHRAKRPHAPDPAHTHRGCEWRNAFCHAARTSAWCRRDPTPHTATTCDVTDQWRRGLVLPNTHLHGEQRE